MVTAQAITEDRAAEILAKLDRLQSSLDRISARQRAQDELIEELMPIAKLMMSTGNEKLAELEQKGYFTFGKALLGVLDKVVTGFSANDVEMLGDNVVQILSTVRHLTQPAILAVADEATTAIEEAKASEPLTFTGMVKASRDEDFQRGVAAAVAVLRRVGQLAHQKTAERTDAKARLATMLGPSKPKALPAGHAAPRAQAPAPARRPAPAKTAPAPKAEAECCTPKIVGKSPGIVLEGVTLDPEGFLADWQAWDRGVAERMAQAIKLPPLSDIQWKVIDFARAEYQETKKSPNVRRLSVGSGVSVKDLYTLFPGTPGKSIARVAGLPKPVGCI